MKFVQVNAAFTIQYPAYDQDGELFVQASVYDVTTGEAVLSSTLPLTLDADGVYSAEVEAGSNRGYLVITAAYTDDTYETPDETRAPVAECYYAGNPGATMLLFNYGVFNRRR